MYALHLTDIRNNNYECVESSDLNSLISQLIIVVISNKDFTYGCIRNRQNLSICNASFKGRFNWLNINGVKDF